MPVARATPTDLLSRVRDALRADAQQAAGNAQLSRSEQATLSNALMKETAEAMRVAGGSGVRIDVDGLVDATAERVSQLLGQVNQRSGSGAATISQQEIRDLAALNGSAAELVVRAYELITGRTVSIGPAGTVTPPDPPTANGPLALSNVRLRYNPDNISMEVSASATALTLKGMARLPATLELDVGARHLRLRFSNQPGATGGAVGVRTVIERLRDELPELDLHVSSFLQGRAVIDFWPRGTAPRNPTPVYGSGPGEMTGPLSCKINATELPPGTTWGFRVDEKVYTATTRPGRTNSWHLYADLKRAMEADGRTVQYRSYGRMENGGFASLRITG